MAGKSAKEIARFEYKKAAADQAEAPWPTKAMLARNHRLLYKDKAGRLYYEVGDGAEDWIKDKEMSYDLKTSEALWVRLPPKTTQGGMPEESEKIELERDKGGVKSDALILEASTHKSSRSRGTGLVVVKHLKP